MLPSLLLFAAAHAGGIEDAPPPQAYNATYLSTGIGARGETPVPWGTVDLTWLHRYEIVGPVGLEFMALGGLLFSVDGVGLRGSAAATVDAFFNRGGRVGYKLGVGPSLSVELTPDDNVYGGFNLMVTGGIDLREHGFATGTSFIAAIEIPTEKAPAVRKVPVVTFGVGFLIPEADTRMERDLARSQGGWRPPEPELKPVPTPGPGPAPELPPPAPTTVGIDEVDCELKLTAPILFAHASAVPIEDSLPIIDDMAAVLVAHPDIKLRLEGHTDSNGGDSLNMKLSKLRVDAVIGLLIQRGVAADRLEGVGYGETQPLVADAKTDEDHAKNRRVVYRVTAGLNCVKEAP